MSSSEFLCRWPLLLGVVAGIALGSLHTAALQPTPQPAPIQSTRTLVA